MFEGRIVILRPPLDKDIEFFLSLRNNIELQVALMSLPRPNTVDRVKEWLDRRLKSEQDIFFVVAEKETNDACGFIQLSNMDFIHGVGELGICLVQSAQGKGYAGEAVSLLEEYAVSVFRIRKIILKVLVSNKRAISFYEKMGYSPVGVHKQHFYSQRMFHDVMVMEKMLEAGLT